MAGRRWTQAVRGRRRRVADPTGTYLEEVDLRDEQEGELVRLHAEGHRDGNQEDVQRHRDADPYRQTQRVEHDQPNWTPDRQLVVNFVAPHREER